MRHLPAKWAYLLVAAVLLSTCVACANQPVVSSDASSQPAVSSDLETPSASTSDNIIPGPSNTVRKMGKELLETYQVQYDQRVRFMLDGWYYESHGALPLTTVEDARSKYPQLHIPAQIGGYRFVDLTVHLSQTESVFPDELPTPTDATQVIPDNPPDQYYLCYRDDTTQFRIALWPKEDAGFEDRVEFSIETLIPWPLYDNVYVEPEYTEENQFSFILITPTAEQGYAFFVHKMETSDCYESGHLAELTEQEAISIYEAIQKDFSTGTA